MDKIAVVSDIHGNIEALEAVADDIKRRGIINVVNLGDNASGPLWPKETISFLMKQDWINISGNQDRTLSHGDPAAFGASDRYAYSVLTKDEINWLKGLPASFKMVNGIFLFHGSPDDDTVYLMETIAHGKIYLATPEEIEKRLNGVKYPLMLCGHTHFPRMVEINDNILIVNAGSVGLQAYYDDLPEYHVVENGSPHARYAIVEKVENRWQAEFVMVTYDYAKAIIQAKKNVRGDWVAGLKGFM